MKIKTKKYQVKYGTIFYEFTMTILENREVREPVRVRKNKKQQR
jgi:hypothetical protein